MFCLNSRINFNDIAGGQEVSLPGWISEGEFVAMLKRPSLLSLAASGVIPNELLACAKRLFNEGISEQMPIDELGRVLNIIAENALVSPSMSELEEKGVSLTDMQLAAIYNFAMTGVRRLACFPQLSQNIERTGDVG